MFQFSGFAHLSVYYVFNIVGCPIRISTDQFVCANPRSFSQLITSFFASESLGIPHTPLFCLLYYYCMYCYMQCVLSTLLLFSYLNMSMNVARPHRFLNQHRVLALVENIGVDPMTSCV